MTSLQTTTSLFLNDRSITVRFYPDPLSLTPTAQNPVKVKLGADGSLDMNAVAKALGRPLFDIALIDPNGKEVREWRQMYSVSWLQRVTREDGHVGISDGSRYRVLNIASNPLSTNSDVQGSQKSASIRRGTYPPWKGSSRHVYV